MFKKKEEVVKPEEVVEAIPKPVEVVKEQEAVWEVGRMPTEFQPVLVKGEVAMSELEALAKILNLLEKVSKGLGVK